MSASQSTVSHETVAFRFVETSIAELCGISEQGESVCAGADHIVAPQFDLPLDDVCTREVADLIQS